MNVTLPTSIHTKLVSYFKHLRKFKQFISGILANLLMHMIIFANIFT